MKYNVKLVENYMKNNNFSKTALCRKCGICLNTLNKIFQQKDISFMSFVKLTVKAHIDENEFLMIDNESEYFSICEFMTDKKEDLNLFKFNLELIDKYLIEHNLSKQQIANLSNISTEVLDKIYQQDVSVQYKSIRNIIQEMEIKFEKFFIRTNIKGKVFLL